jgi:urea transport system ATP-binding protein
MSAASHPSKDAARGELAGGARLEHTGPLGAHAPLLAFNGLVGGYGGLDVIRGVSGALKRGEVLCVIGRNGVGKSTLLKLLFGLLDLRQGSIEFDGRAIQPLEASRRRALGISYCPQERPVFDDLSVRDNLTLMRADRRVEAFEASFARFPILKRRLNQHAGTLSGGEKKMLSFVRGLSEAQPLLLLDEPSEGVQWENIEHIAAAIGEAKAQGRALIVVEQNLAFAELIADRYLVLEQGQVALTGARGEVSREQLLAHLHV